MKKVYMIILSVILAVGMIGCGNEKKSETAELNEEKTEGYSEPVTIEEVSQSTDRVYGEECVGVVTISINPEIDLHIDKDGNVLSYVFQNEDAETAYKNLSLKGIQVNDAVKIIVETAEKSGYLKDGGEVTVIYGATGNGSAEKAHDMIESARDTVRDTLNELGKESVVTLEMKNYTQDTSDICDLCFGVGSIVCEQCSGVGHGNGMTTCDLCKGTGIIDENNSEGGNGPAADGACRLCHGTGIMTIQAQKCYICNGTGLCINCGGSGIDTVPTDRGEYGSCHACGGNGDCLQEVCEGGIMTERHETCRDCGGTGKDTGKSSGPEPSNSCNRCDDTGFMECNGCGGTLMGTCYRCNGTGKKIQ
ncbi:MAG: hypothetical protein ACI4E1_01445 [Lachnospira sp.]